MAGRRLLLGIAARRRLGSGFMSADLASARLEWERAYGDLAELARDPVQGERVRLQLDAVSAELRRRVGGTFTLRELSDEYVVADGWARDVLGDQADSGLDAHAGSRRGRGVPPLRTRCGRLRAVSMLDQPSRRTRAAAAEPSRCHRARRPPRRRVGARVPPRARVRADARRAAEVEWDGDDRPYAHAAAAGSADAHGDRDGHRSLITALLKPRAARRG